MQQITSTLSNLRWPAVVLAAMFGLYELGGRAAEWVWMFAYNLRWPILTATALIVTFCGVVLLNAADTRNRTTFGDPENTDAKWRQSASVQGAIMMIILTALVMAIPSPTYNVRLVPGPERIVKVPGPIQWRDGVKIVQKASSYDDTYGKCVESISGNHTDEELAQCHRQAMEVVNADKPKPQVVYRIKHDPYQDVFNNCNDKYGFDGIPAPQAAALRNQRLEICHRAALESTR